MPITSPLDIPNCQVWLDASDLNTLWGLSGAGASPSDYRPTATGQLVGFIQDKSSNGRHFTNFTGSEPSRPQLIRDLQNNRSILRFNGVNYLTSLFVIPISAQTVFAVASRRLVLNQSEGRIYTQNSIATPLSSDKGNATSNHFIPMVIEGGGSFCGYISGAFYALNPPPYLSAFDVYTSSLSTNSVSGILVNYVAGLSTVLYPARRNGQFLNVATTRIGGGISANSVDLYAATTYTFLTGDIGEIIMYDRYLTREERSSVEWYLANKWNLPLHFYATSPGNWSDERIWSISGVPLPLSNVYANSYPVNINQSVRVGGLFTTHSTPQNTVSPVGTFYLLSSFSINAAVSGIRSGSTTCLVVSSSTNTTNFSITGDIIGGTAAAAHGVSLSGLRGTCTLFGNITGGSNATAYGVLLIGDSLAINPKLDLNIFGDIVGNTGTGLVNDTTNYVGVTGQRITSRNTSSSYGILNNRSFGGIFVNSNFIGGGTSTSYGLFNNGFCTHYGDISASSVCPGAINNNLYEGYGSIVASPGSNGFVGTGRNLLSCRFFNASGGTQAVFATSFLVPNLTTNMGTYFDRRYLVTNLLSSSNNFSLGNWSQPFQPVTIAPNSYFAPIRNIPQTAHSISTNTSTGIFSLRRFVNVAAQTQYNFSVYARPDESINFSDRPNLELFFTPLSSEEYGWEGAIFTPSPSQQGSIVTTSSRVSADVCCFENNTKFSRYSIMFTSVSARNNAIIEIRLTTSSSLSQHVVGNSNQKLYIYGAQLTTGTPLVGYVETSDLNTSVGAQSFNPGDFESLPTGGSSYFAYIDATNFNLSRLPSPDNVVQGTQYAGYTPFGFVSSLTGNLVVPPVNSVGLNTPVGNGLAGAAILTVQDALQIWNVGENTITTPGSIGERLKQISNIFDAGSALNTMNI